MTVPIRSSILDANSAFRDLRARGKLSLLVSISAKQDSTAVKFVQRGGIWDLNSLLKFIVEGGHYLHQRPRFEKIYLHATRIYSGEANCWTATLPVERQRSWFDSILSSCVRVGGGSLTDVAQVNLLALCSTNFGINIRAFRTDETDSSEINKGTKSGYSACGVQRKNLVFFLQ